jgi:16S rRNA (cytosine1402-N4)-methyltransferase
MPAEVLEALAPREGALFLDGTLGDGGHAGLLLAQGARVVGMDQDADALANACEELARYGPLFTPLRGNFRNSPSLLSQVGVHQLDGILLDLGVSSHQLDTTSRGFSFQKNGPLDMRMDTRASMTAADIVNTASVAELTRIFREYGEEPCAAKVASAIVAARAARPLETTFDLVAVVESVLHRHSHRSPATRVFQALRIAVNDELGALREALGALSALLVPGGRFAIITFHSLEDRIVKRFFREGSTAFLDRPEWPAPRPNPAYQFRLIPPFPVFPQEEEKETNPRARSAKLRVVEKLSPEVTK